MPKYLFSPAKRASIASFKFSYLPRCIFLRFTMRYALYLFLSFSKEVPRKLVVLFFERLELIVFSLLVQTRRLVLRLSSLLWLIWSVTMPVGVLRINL